MDRQQLVTDILDNINTVRRGLYVYMQHSLDDLSLSSSQSELFFAIRRLQPVGSKQLAQQLRLTPGAISQLVESLVQANLIERHTEQSDRRRQSLRLTPSGETQYEAIQLRRQKIFKGILGNMTDDELLQWHKVQLRIIEQMSKLAQTDKTPTEERP